MRLITLSLVASTLASCAYLGSYQSESAQYAALIENQLQENRLFVRGEQRLAIKALAGSQKMFDLQSQVAPGFEFRFKPALHQVIVGISSQNRIPFSSGELKFRLDDQPPVGVEELTSSFHIQTLYPFAYPYYRVFVVDFIGSEKLDREFSVHSSRGPLSVKLRFFPVSQNRVD
jgi:hypothetical protein